MRDRSMCKPQEASMATSGRRSFLIGAGGAFASAVAAPLILSRTSPGQPLPPSKGDISRLKALIERMAPNAWLEIPDSRIGNVLAPRNAAPLNGGVVGPLAVFAGGNGSAFDPATHRQYFCGGGLMNYTGNEVYCFDYELLRWFRLTEPSQLVADRSRGADEYRTADGTPMTSYTRDGLCWCPLTKT